MPSPLVAELTELKARLGEPLAEVERAAIELRVGLLSHRVGELDQAMIHLTTARKVFERHHEARRVAQADAHIGLICAMKGEHDRAASFFARARAAAEVDGDPDLGARIANCMAEAAERAGEPQRAWALWEQARAHFETYWDGGELSRLYGGQALAHVARNELEAGERLSEKALEEAEAAADPLWLGRALVVRAEVRWKAGDLRAARRFYRRAMSVLLEHDLRRELAEAYLRFGLFVGDAGDRAPDAANDPPAFYLAKAQELFRDLGGLRDLERVRDAFRRFGRRTSDKIAEVQVLELLGELKQNREEVQRRTQHLVEAAQRALEDGDRGDLTRFEGELGRALDQMALCEERFVGALNTVIVERENIRTLLELCRSLSAVQDLARLPADIAKMAAQLTGSDRALVALVDGQDGPATMQGAVRIKEDDPSWREPVARVTAKGGNPTMFHTQAPPRHDEPPRAPDLGRAMACPLRHGATVFGAIYCDKELCGGVYGARDLDLLTIFAAQVSTILENGRVAEELRMHARTRSATLEAISDAVFTLSPAGKVTPVNAAAKRVVALAQLDVTGLTLDRWPDLTFLGALLARGEELDGRVVRMQAGDFLANARCVRGDSGEVLGLVATLTEMRRATSLAQRIVGSTAHFTFADIIGGAPSLRRRLQLAEAAARSDSSVLITGESGTGKELLAQAIHNAGPRAAGPFVGINCAAIPRELLESELLGYEAGAFTGAKKGGHPGKFELAEGGTVLLDEIGDMPLEVQAKLLRVLADKRVFRLGGTREIPLDCRVIATTTRDLAEEAERGRFRQDLFFRLRVIHIELPPLRERVEDIATLVEHFLSLFSARLGKSVRGVTPQILQLLQEYPWPGNVRELEHVLEGEVNLAAPTQELLTEIPVMLENSARRHARAAQLTTPMFDGLTPPLGAHPGLGTGEHDLQSIAEAERQLLIQALTRHHGSVPDVARSLGVSRGTVYNKMKKFQIDPTSYR